MGIDQKKIRETKLVRIMPDLGKTHMSIALKDSIKKLMPRDSLYKALKEKVPKVEKKSIGFQKEVFVVKTLTIEVRGSQDNIELTEE